MNYYTSFFVVFSVLGMALAPRTTDARFRRTKVQTQKVQDQLFQLPTPGKPITIVLHGTRVLFPGLYHQTTTPYGLHKATTVSKLRFFCRVAHALAQSDTELFPLENMYTYGWGGDLCFDVREKEGAQLYALIKKLKAMPEYADTKITLVTHSHGGNVALNCAKAALLDGQTSALVDCLILIASPVQDLTHDYCVSPVFKNVYHFYSRGDMLQIADPQGMYAQNKKQGGSKTFFSRREFDIVHTKLKQIEVTWGTYPVSHIDFVLSRGFIKRLPAILALLDDPAKATQFSSRSSGIFRLDYSKVKRTARGAKKPLRSSNT